MRYGVVPTKIFYTKIFLTKISLHENFWIYGIVCYFCQMLPLLKRSTDNLVAVIEEKATSEQTFEVFKYV